MTSSHSPLTGSLLAMLASNPLLRATGVDDTQFLVRSTSVIGTVLSSA